MASCDNCGKPARTVYRIEEGCYENVGSGAGPHYEYSASGSFTVAVCSSCQSKFRPTGKILDSWSA